jgi:SAM-dependent methyltransferase
MPSPPTLALLRRYLGPPPLRLVDIGCGLGSYACPLTTDGYDWLGVEVSERECAELAKRALPHVRAAAGAALPFSHQMFDAAICIEVLEHIAEPDPFIAEIRRIAKRLLVSVPNIELLPYLSPHMAVPWHMLEADHKNFFTRWGLRGLLRRHFGRVEIVDYAPAPLPTVEGTTLYYHLFAIADV